MNIYIIVLRRIELCKLFLVIQLSTANIIDLCYLIILLQAHSLNRRIIIAATNSRVPQTLIKPYTCSLCERNY